MMSEPRKRDNPQRSGGVDGTSTSFHVQRARRGDGTSLAWLVERLSPLLLAQASYRLGPQLRRICEPEDLVAEVWLVALPRLPTLRQDRARETPTLLKFLSTTLLNLINNLARKALRHGSVQREADLPEPFPANDAIEQVPSDVSGVITRAIRGERLATVAAGIDALGPKDREILILRGIEQSSNQEVALRLGLKPNTAEHRYLRALRKLKAQLPQSVFADLDEQ